MPGERCPYGQPDPCPLGFPGCHCADDAVDDFDWSKVTEDDLRLASPEEPSGDRWLT